MVSAVGEDLGEDQRDQCRYPADPAEERRHRRSNPFIRSEPVGTNAHVCLTPGRDQPKQERRKSAAVQLEMTVLKCGSLSIVKSERLWTHNLPIPTISR